MDWGGGAIALGRWGYVLAFFVVVWSTNLFNFMDGIDGIASVEAAMVLLPGAFFLWINGGAEYALPALVVVSAILGFLVWNRSPARIFMGDAGSYFLGFFIMALGIAGETAYGVPMAVWLLLYAVFWFDATVTLVRRMVAGDVLDKAHRNHAYQRLVRRGWSHNKVVCWMAAVNLVLTALAAAGCYHRPYLPLFGLFMVAVCGVLYLLVERLIPFAGDANS